MLRTCFMQVQYKRTEIAVTMSKLDAELKLYSVSTKENQHRARIRFNGSGLGALHKRKICRPFAVTRHRP
jgi:hypothetical protein